MATKWSRDGQNQWLPKKICPLLSGSFGRFWGFASQLLIIGFLWHDVLWSSYGADSGGRHHH
jgi:hypothetical protein